jgi:hypothetical protein
MEILPASKRQKILFEEIKKYVSQGYKPTSQKNFSACLFKEEIVEKEIVETIVQELQPIPIPFVARPVSIVKPSRWKKVKLFFSNLIDKIKGKKEQAITIEEKPEIIETLKEKIIITENKKIIPGSILNISVDMYGVVSTS